MSHWTPAWLAALLLLTSAREGAAAEKPFFVYSATFPYDDLPKDLWPARLVQLKGLGFNTVQVRAGSDTRAVVEVLRLARQVGLRVWLDLGQLPPELQSFTASRGGPILEAPKGHWLAWFPTRGDPPAPPRLLSPADFTGFRRLAARPGRLPVLISAFDAGWDAGDDVRAAPSSPSNYLLATRELLAAGVKGLNCAAAIEGRSPPHRESVIGPDGELRPQGPVFRRNGALLAQFGPLLAAMEPAEASSVHLLLGPKQKPPPLLRLGLLAGPASRGPVFISALNYSDERAVTGTLVARDPRHGKPMVIHGLDLPPRQALLMPLNLPLAQPEVCSTCSAFAPAERLVSATAELLGVSFENGVLGLEFVAPAEGVLVLELARRPEGPLITGARLRQFDWDEKTHLLRITIPAGQPPDFHSRVGLAIQLPETSAFLKTPRRFIIGSTALVTAAFSSPDLAGRSRLLAPAGWRVKADPGPADAAPEEMRYSLEVPADAIPGDTATLAIETDGKVAQTAVVPLAPFCSLRVEPEEALHPRRDSRFAIRPRLAAMVLPGRLTYHVYLRNGHDEIKTFGLAAAGQGLRLSPAREEVSVGANLEREITIEAAPLDPRPGLYRWTLEVREGPRRLELPLTLAVIPEGGSLAYEVDLDRDGFPELVLENQKLRVVFSPHYGGRSTEFLLKSRGLNAFTAHGALDARAVLQGRVAGPARIELRSPELERTISLGGRDDFVEIEQTGGPAEWTLSAPSGLEAAKGRFTVEAPGAKIETDQKPFSARFRVTFSEAAPRRARLWLQPTELK